MKTRESGMPCVETWQGFFDPPAALLRLGLEAGCRYVVDFGCGYGTFAIPAAKLVSGKVVALDIEREMVDATRSSAAGLANLQVLQRDIVQDGCGIADAAADYVMLFNLLHAAEAAALLAEARRILTPRGKLGVMHWNYDPATPRGPSMAIRLKPEQCAAMVRQAGFRIGPLVQLPPYHYGFAATPARNNSPFEV